MSMKIQELPQDAFNAGIQAIEMMVPHAPHDIPQHIVAAAAVVGAGVLTRNKAIKTYDKTSDEYAVEFPNADQLEKSLNIDEATNRKLRLAPFLGMATGATIALGSWAGGIHSETSHANADANTIVVSDTSYSMTKTADLGSKTTRLMATNEGLKAIDYSGKIGIVQAASESADAASGNKPSTAQVTMNLTKDWHNSKALSNEPQVDPNGTKLVPAIKLAASLLPSGAHGEGRSGNVIVASDGTVNDSKEDLSKLATDLKKEGVGIKIVVPGTSDGTYKLDKLSDPTPAGAEADTFSAFGGNVTEAHTVKEVVDAMHKEVASAGTTKHEYPYWPLIVLGAGMVATNLGRLARNILGKKV